MFILWIILGSIGYFYIEMVVKLMFWKVIVLFIKWWYLDRKVINILKRYCFKVILSNFVNF